MPPLRSRSSMRGSDRCSSGSSGWRTRSAATKRSTGACTRRLRPRGMRCGAAGKRRSNSSSPERSCTRCACKSEQEIELMRRAGEITRKGHIAGMRATHPGMWEYELEAVIEYAYRMDGSPANAYPSIVAGGANATILHYNSNREQLEDGTLVLVDSAAEFELYASDVTRTWPVNGRFSAEQRAIYEVVLAAQKASIEEVRPGKPFRAYHETAVRVLCEGLVDIGLLEGKVEDLIASEGYRDFYPHNTGHWLGMDVHDVGRYRDSSDNWRILEPGMVMTVEPGIYVQQDVNVDARWKGIGVRLEDDILCSASGPENLTPGIPKEIDELESIVGADAKALAR